MDSRRRSVRAEQEGVFAAPAKTCYADFEIVSFEGRRRNAQCFEPVEDAGFGHTRTVFDEPWNDVVHCLEGIDRFVEDGGEPGGRGHEALHQWYDGVEIHCITHHKIGAIHNEAALLCILIAEYSIVHKVLAKGICNHNDDTLWDTLLRLAM